MGCLLTEKHEAVFQKVPAITGGRVLCEEESGTHLSQLLPALGSPLQAGGMVGKLGGVGKGPASLCYQLWLWAVSCRLHLSFLISEVRALARHCP